MTSGQPLILLTNDDGVDAIGLSTMARHLAGVGEVMIVAPDRERSAVGHGISLGRPLRVVQLGTAVTAVPPAELEPRRFAVSGTPADSVLVALFHLCAGRRPALVVSGINPGPNIGTDVFYSGTLAGAIEGALHGLPALAVSQDLPRPDGPTLVELLERTGRFAARLAARLIAVPPPDGVTLNLNAPATLGEEQRWTRMGRRAYREQVVQRRDPRGVPYYWVGGAPLPGENEPGTDAHALEQGFISVTPLGLDLTTPLPACYSEWTVASAT